ncbi:phosphoethanolamine--lipid A transferase [Halomonas sp. SpR1]|uniref:phosphoethanolamine transferase n=1 Tax=Halomonas sp. SpR1 TaxID=3050462 RepID=UPI0027E5AFCD|nr:phosphoethanolamine--lipid A transferase [Halomonas sp. SpR1]MDQ7732107.1 phosphoethanolamine--lipid A transferase [Halomonas sp. SpR1]
MNRNILFGYKSIYRAISYRPRISSDLLTLLVTISFTLIYNNSLWKEVLHRYDISEASSIGIVILMFLIITSLHFVVFLLFSFYWSSKIVLTILLLVASSVSYFTSSYGVYFDTTMLDNVLQTDTSEARELLTLGLLFHLSLYFILPSIVLWRVDLKKTTWPKAMLRRLAYWLGGVAVLLLSTILSYQDVSSLMRNNKELRYLITPGNYLVSMVKVITSEAPSADTPRLSVGADAFMEPNEEAKPKLLVIVVGEAVRAANWGLNDYQRQTTPELTNLSSVINFKQVTSCGTSTAVSLPCMFSLPGRREYDKAYARQHESLLDVLKRAGLNVIWIENQSGCKGVCDRVANWKITADEYPQLCQEGRCLDEALVYELSQQISQPNPRDTVIILHQLGNHGPSYFQRYPSNFERFMPTCKTADLSQCSQEEITNSYDNAILYTDHILSQTIEMLANQSNYDASMIYLSDHGESLGEKGLYLHGIPYAIAPDEQTHIPMLWWLSPTFSQRESIDIECLNEIAENPASHDNLFHSVLGLLNVSTMIYQDELDISKPCSG